MSKVDIEQLKEIERDMEHGLPSMVRLPDSLRASIKDISEEPYVEMWAFTGGAKQGGTGKAMPVFQILKEELKAGRLTPGITAYIPSSGGAALSAAYYRQAYGIGKIVPVLEKSVPIDKQTQIVLPGDDENVVIEHPREGQTAIERAYELQKEHGGLVINQYEHPGSVHGHKWTMDHIAREMKSKRINKIPSFFCAGAGTCSTLVAAHQYLKGNHFPNLQVVGVAVSPDQEVPGCRTLKKIQRDITFDWKKAIAPYEFVFCDRKPAFERSRNLIRKAIPAGPSSGLALEGFFQFFRQLYEKGQLARHLNHKHRYVVVFMFMDGSQVYMPEYRQVLGINLQSS
jgi:cysteine synthase